MKKFVWIGVFVSSILTGFQVKATSKLAAESISVKSDSLIVYQVENDSLKRQLIATGGVKGILHTSSSNKRIEKALDDEKTPVHPRDLPSAIKASLSSDEFKDWKTSSARFVKTVNGTSYYEIALLKENNAKIAKFKGNGKVL